MGQATTWDGDEYRRGCMEAGGLDPDWYDRVADVKEWRRLLAEVGLSPEQVEWLRKYHEGHDGSSKVGRTSRWWELQFRHWAVEVLGTHVDLQPGGRAILRHPERDELTVEIRWRSEYGQALVTSWTVSAPSLPWADIAQSTYTAAFHLELSRKPEVSPQAVTPPSAGRPASIAFYRKLLADYEALMREGVRAPAKELASRMGEKPGTVKVWLHRGKQYLKRGEDDHGEPS